MQNIRAAKGLPFMPADGTTLSLHCRKFKNNFKHIEALNTNTVLARVNIYYYAQIILFCYFSKNLAEHLWHGLIQCNRLIANC